MKTTRKRTKGICLAMVLFLIAGVLSMAGAGKAEAAKKKMDTLKLQWDLKEGKKYVAACNDKLKLTADSKIGFTLKNVKKEKLKNGKKKVSFTIIFQRPNYKLSSQDIHNNINYGSSVNVKVYGDYYFTVVDKATGLTLEGNNDLDVEVKSNGWKRYRQYAKQYDNDGCWIYYDKYYVVKVVIIYPEDYKDLCVGIGNAVSIAKWKNKNDTFWDGRKSFDKTTYYKWFKDDVHFINFK